MESQEKEAIFNLLQTTDDNNISLAFELINALGESTQEFLKPLENFLRANVFLQEYLLSSDEKHEGYYKEGYKRLFQLENFAISGRNRYNPASLVMSDDIRYLQGIKSLVWHYSELSKVSAVLPTLKRLERVYLDNNQIKVLPNSIVAVEHLKLLSLSNNHIAVLPEDLGNLEELEYLYLHNNKLTTLPASIGRLKNLKQLTIQGNFMGIDDIPSEILNSQLLPTHILKSIKRQLNSF
jgi:Leucine-rich repeat (LRR) protein